MSLAVRCLCLAVAALEAGAGRAAPPDALAAFEAEVRPVLAEHCYSCHGPDKQKGGLRLDTKAGWQAGGDGGPAVVPGDPDASPLVRAVRYADPVLQMPPKGKLPAARVAALERWVRAGAVDPRDGTAAKPVPSAADHWAFRPVRDSDPAASIDAIVRAKQKATGVVPNPPADRRTLLRRLSFALVGLPPTFEEAEAFVADPSPAAVERVVDALLASPRFGERWGRHWLDVARYADTKDGVLQYGDDRVRPFAYAYRDWVIRAVNEDRPFDRFVREQLAADRLGGPPDTLAAMGFLTLGRIFDENEHDVIDDRIDVVTRGLLGLTVGCARCHDHKIEPVPTTDYYALYGVFAASEAPLVPPPLDPAATGPAKYAADYAKAVAALTDQLASQHRAQSEDARRRTPDYLRHVATTAPDPADGVIFFRSLDPGDLRPYVTARWRTYLKRRAAPGDPVFGPWGELMALPDDKIAAAVRAAAGRPGVNPRVAAALRSGPVRSKDGVARVYGYAFRRAYEQVGPPDPATAELLACVLGRDAPAYFPLADTPHYMSRAEWDAFGAKRQGLDTLAVREPAAPARAMCLTDAATAEPQRVFVRGSPSRPGQPVGRRFLTVLGGKAFGPGSGRLDLANAVVSPDNPLTARVFVNRVWGWLVGEPLVDTPSDFGVRTPQPAQAELLDHLAAGFVRDGWSVKRLVRRIVLSDTYQQSSGERPEVRSVDPQNRLLWRANRRRLDLEAMRDGLLSVSGRIEHRLYGRPGDATSAGDRRRTLYGLVDRQSLPGLFRAFDFASPDQSAERRATTTVPQQALFALNSPFVQAQATALAGRVRGADDAAGTLHRLALGREPTAAERALAREFVAAADPGGLDRLGGWELWAQVLLMCNEFVFVD